MTKASTKIFPGLYRMSCGDKSVTIEHQKDGWHVRADFDRHLYSDFVATKRIAVAIAKDMLSGQ